MVARKFFVSFNGDHFEVDFDTEDDIEVLKFQLFSLTSVLPEEQKIIGSDDVIITEDSDLKSISNNLRLLSISEESEDGELDSSLELGGENLKIKKVNFASDELKLLSVSGEGGSLVSETLVRGGGDDHVVESSDDAFVISDEELARALQAEEEALFFQQYRASDNGEEFEQRVRPYIAQVLMYEDPVRQEAARKSVSVDELEERALVSLAKEGNFKPSEDEQNHAFLLQLLFWFKQSFSIVRIAKIEAGVVTKDSMRFDGVGLKMNPYKETTEREGHCAINVVGGEDGNVLKNYRSKSHDRVTTLMQIVHLIDGSDHHEVQSKKTNTTPNQYPESNKLRSEVLSICLAATKKIMGLKKLLVIAKLRIDPRIEEGFDKINLEMFSKKKSRRNQLEWPLEENPPAEIVISRWVNSPPCDDCGSCTVNCGMGVPLPHEIQFGGSRVELYRCNNCSRVTRFPRYNDPLKLVETKKGRCGEWANCFTLYCRAFHYKSRLILDFTDHVWTECFSNYLGRWMHLDPCEGVYDNPLLYEMGWKKKLSYVIAFGKDGVHDVTKRYTRKWHEVLIRRNITTESVVSTILFNMRKEFRRGFTSQAISVLEDNDKNETQELERDLHSQVDGSISLPGRLSGAKEWRIARSEVGSDQNDSLSCSSCPVRVCVDEHVSNIYDAFYPLLLQLIGNGLSNFETVEILEALKILLVDLNKRSFRVRKISINTDSKTSNILHRNMPAIRGLLAALSLKTELETDWTMSICLAGDPVKTSISLPVVLDALGDIIDNLKSYGQLIKDSLSLPFLKVNRISSGLVLASGEELPFGIVTCAFDGTRQSKWEEPNGSKGCWLMYKVRDGQMYELEAYELMSANDAPERDPMNWVIEGSNDGGMSWHLLDKQTSQIFEKRFQCKTFRIGSVRQLSNTFRFTFLSVRDVQATSRLQIGSIDLYAKPN
ncbi:hypothetical protein GIB67_016072 [Kingdonia uniflora]|uniref:Transglutaminase-like domain-containing protein n=1 Tax=Kingdonia uniflora TaxID=39325 RepID=A0A7J7L1W2_9MAGN|nr:hypothetical protein GIB67_016072 [Kingdonia uniflora]